MFLTNLSIKNSLTVFVLVFIIAFMGINAYVSLPREAAPDITIPYIIVNTLYTGVSPSDIETLVTNPLERKLRNLENVKNITSSSADSFSSIAIEYNSGADIEDALRKVKDQVDLAKRDLPEDAEDPEVIEINISDIPIMVVNISAQYGLVQLKEIAETIKEEIETVKGVLDVTISGGLEREIHVIPDGRKLKKYELSLNQISNVLRSENLNIPGGIVDIGRRKHLVRIPAEFETVSEIKNLVIASPKGNPIYLRDVAVVVDSFKEKTSYSRMNNISSVSLSIQKRTGKNVIKIANQIKLKLDELAATLPRNTNVNIVGDQSETISDMVDELENSIVLGLLLVCVVLLFFLGFKNAFFVATAIPFSMMISFVVIQLMGYTLNMVMLFALILALGMLVDNAIVIVENIYRYIENGHPRKEAAMLATKEVGWPVIASTATTIAVFFPLLFIPGIAGEFMKFLPICLITTISASLFVAMVINPVICANFMRVKKTNPKNSSKSNEPPAFIQTYQRMLKFSLAHPVMILSAAVAAFVFSLALLIATSPGTEFFPDVTPSKIYVDIKAAPSASLDATNDIVSSIERQLFGHPNIKNIITTVGASGGGMFGGGGSSVNSARIIVEFKDKPNWIENPKMTVQFIREMAKKVPGVQVNVTAEDMGPPSGAPIAVQIIGKEFDQLAQYAEIIKETMRKLGGIVDIDDDYAKGKPEIIININRDRTSMLGLNTMLLASTIRTSIQGSKVSVFRDGVDEYDIILRLPEDERNNIQRVEELFIMNQKGVPIPLVEVANIRTSRGIGSIRHENADRVITIKAKPALGYIASERLSAISKQLTFMTLENGYSIHYAGENEMMMEVQDYLLKAFFIAILLIAMILITQFNSIVLPFVILCSIFLSLIGIFLGLVIFHRPFGVMMTGIGIISLAGVIVNNAIVLIDYINQLKASGMGRFEAIVQAGSVRLRPVLLTAVTTILGLVPMTFGINFDFKHFFLELFSSNIFTNFVSKVELGAQSTEFWGSMGSAVTIGLAVGTVLTLFIVPVLYFQLDKLRHQGSFLVGGVGIEPTTPCL